MKHFLILLSLVVTPAFAQGTADLIDRIQRLEAQIRSANGQIEQLSYKNSELENRLKKQGEDNEFRFSELEKGKGANNAPRPTTNSPTVPTRPATIGGLADQATTPPRAGLTADPNAGGLTGLEQPTPDGQFRKARQLIADKKYEQAESQFRLFLDQYPKDKQVGDATYYLGESLYQRKLYKDSTAHFLKVTTTHTSALRSQNAILRLGQALYALGEREQACGAYGEMVRRFPNVDKALQPALDAETKRARC